MAGELGGPPSPSALLSLEPPAQLPPADPPTEGVARSLTFDPASPPPLARARIRAGKKIVHGLSYDSSAENRPSPATHRALPRRSGTSQGQEDPPLCGSPVPFKDWSLNAQALANAANIRCTASTSPTPPLLVLNCGLGNRLRALLSYRLISIEGGANLAALWAVSEACPGLFGDVFEPLSGTTILATDGHSSCETAALGVHGVHDFHELVKLRRHEEARCFFDLTPRKAIRLEVASAALEYGTYIALHIRRTDHYAVEVGVQSKDEEFERFADRYPTHTIYLATDNGQTQRRFVERYGATRLRIASSIDETRNWRDDSSLRLTSLHSAVVDMFVCVRADVFKGSSFSSFSDAVSHLRTCAATTHGEDEHSLLEPGRDFESRRHRHGAGSFKRRGGLNMRTSPA